MAIGYILNPYVALEAEVSYNKAEIDSSVGVRTGITCFVLGKWVHFGNNVYSERFARSSKRALAPLYWRWQGVADFSLKDLAATALPSATLSGSDLGLALQAIAGINYAISDRVRFLTE